MRVARLLLAALICCAASRGPAIAGLTRHDVLVIANSNSTVSQAVADYYRQKRNIPASHVRLVSCSTGDVIDPAQFVDLRNQVTAHLLSLGVVPEDPVNDPIKAIVLVTDIPHRASDGGESYAAVDSALSACFSSSAWGEEPFGVYGHWQPATCAPNPYYGDYAAPADFQSFRADTIASTSHKAFPTVGFTLVRMFDENTAVAAGGSGLLFRGMRTGDEWQWSPVVGVDKGPISWRVSGMSVLDSTHAYACTGNPIKPHGGGTIIGTADGGLTWTQLRRSGRQYFKLKDAFVGTDFADTSHGWAVGSTQLMYGSRAPLAVRTTDGGANWQDISGSLPASFFPTAVTAADTDNVWICGPDGKIYQSADGGDSWSLANSGAPNVSYNAIWIKYDAGSFKGWAAGDSGTIIRTENGTSWTVQAAGLTTEDVVDLSVYDQDHACAAYGGDSFLTFSQPGGWTVENVSLAPIVSAASASADSTLAVGGTRYIFADSATGWDVAYTGQDSAWRLRYLVMRLDGYVEDLDADGIPDDIEGIIDRACNATPGGKFVLDEPTNIGVGGFQSAYDALVPIVGAGNVVYDQTSTYLTGENSVIGYTSWGMHDSGAESATTWGRPFHNWVDGGVGTVFESTNARAFDKPFYVWGLPITGTKLPNTLSIRGMRSSATYQHYKAVLHSSTGEELASGEFVGGEVHIDIGSVVWPADHKTYVQVYFPYNDPLHPDEAIYNARYPSGTWNTDIYNNRVDGIAFGMTTRGNFLAEMLREGATGGCGNVDEPWSSYVARPAYMFPRYAQGYTWAESAYMALPGIGWQEVAVGDPLMAPYATPPAVSITSPASDGELVSGAVPISATASPVDAPSIEKVEFWLDDDTLLATDTTAPYETVLDTVGEGIADGVHTIEAIAFEGDSVQNTNAAFRTIVVNNTHTLCSTINDARALPDDSAVALEGKIVSAVFDGFFYILESSRVQGIRIVSDVPVSEGDLVTVLGTLGTVDGERRIEAVGVYILPD